MVGSGPHQTSAHQTESANSQRQDDFLNLKRERDREQYRKGSVHTTHISRSCLKGGSHVSQRQDDNKAMQREIDDLKKKLHRAQWKRSPSSSNISSNGEENVSYRRRSKTPLSESPTRKSSTTNKNTRALLAKAWEMTL